MRFIKNFSQIIGIVLFFLIFSACAYKPINRIEARKHGGASGQHLAIQQKNDIQATGASVSTVNNETEIYGSVRYINLSGYQGGLTYGLTNNLALSGSVNSMSYQSTIETKKARDEGGYYPVESYEAKAQSADFKGTVHYYIIDTLNEKNKWKAGQFYGIGLGTGTTISNGDLHRLTNENNNERNWIRGVHDSNYYQIFLQTNHTLMNRIFDISVGNNISMIRNNLKDGQLSKGESTTAFLWQPSVRTSLGYKPVKLFTQVDWTKHLNKQLLDDSEYLYFTIGLQVKLNAGKL